MAYGTLHNNWNCASHMMTKSTGLVTTMNHKIFNINVCIFVLENYHDNFSGQKQLLTVSHEQSENVYDFESSVD